MQNKQTNKKGFGSN